jgi:hypothetical protein
VKSKMQVTAVGSFVIAFLAVAMESPVVAVPFMVVFAVSAVIALVYENLVEPNHETQSKVVQTSQEQRIYKPRRPPIPEAVKGAV